MNRKRKKHQKSAVAIIEEAIYILRSSTNKLLFSYYLGSIPFVLGFFYFFLDMSRSAKAHEYSAAAAFGLAGLFVWMKYWHAIFALRIRRQLSGEEIRLPEHNFSILATQTLIQSTRFIVLPLAALLMVPFGFCYAFYQNANACFAGEDNNFKSTFQLAWHQATLWPRQNHTLIGVFWLFGAVVLINVAVTSFLIPQLIKTLFGYESLFTRSGIRLILNPMFWIVMLGVTYLLLDPIIKTAYALRCFYGAALASGEDLMADLNRVRQNAKYAVILMLIIMGSAIPISNAAQVPLSVSPQQLDQSIEEVINRRDFAWRMPKEAFQIEDQESKGPIAAALKWLMQILAKGINALKDWIAKFNKWLQHLLPATETASDAIKSSWKRPIRGALIALLLLLTAFLIITTIRIWQRRRKTARDHVKASFALVPDPADEGIKADDFPADRWLALAAELSSSGELRLAMRALYLATLAHLAKQDMITIEIYKSNREYERELHRRASGNEEMLAIFSKCLNIFEAVWYGMQGITTAAFDQFAENQKRILAIGGK
jgi:hypothetical protein